MDVFTLDVPCRATLRRIPRGARQRAAQTLDTRLRALLAAPTDLTLWREALRFADCLSQPARGGKRHNLTSQLLTQFDRVAKGLSPTPTSCGDSGPRPPRAKQGGHRGGGEDEVVVARASAKLQEGDIRGRCAVLPPTRPWLPLPLSRSKPCSRSIRPARLIVAPLPCLQRSRSP